MKKDFKQFLILLIVSIFVAFTVSFGYSVYQNYQREKKINEVKNLFNFGGTSEDKKEETKEEIKAETETKEKEVTKDTKEKENAKAKEETKKEDKKEEVAKSSDNSDIKKIDEVISQVMDKKNPDYLLKFNSEELALIRNTLYARRGLKYTKGKYKDYFEGKSWYKPSVTSGKDLLPEKEERLVEIIRKYEKKAKK